MKNIYKINFLVIITLLFSSCAVDDDDAVVPEGSIITASFDKSGDIAVPNGGDAVLNIVLSEAVSTLTQFSYQLNGQDFSVQLNAGETKAPITISTTLGSVDEVTLVSAYTLYNPDVTLGPNTNAKFIGVSDSSTIFTLSWEDDSFDLDFYVVTGDQDFAGTLIDSSFGLTNMETLELPNNQVDQTYSLYVDQFGFTADVPAIVKVIQSNGTVTIFEGVVNQDSFIITFVKTGTDLTFTQLNTF